jgi:hypothetical protein
MSSFTWKTYWPRVTWDTLMAWFARIAGESNAWLTRRTTKVYCQLLKPVS